MAVPTDPTVATLTTEAFRKAFTTDYAPSAAELARGELWLQELFNKIWLLSERTGNTRLKSLQSLLYFTSTKGKRTYDLGEDFDEEFSVSVLDGTVRGTAQAGAAGSITVAADDAMTETQAVGSWIYLTAGTGSTQIRQITAFNTTTKVATVDSNWTTNPTNTTTYLIVSRIIPLDEDNQMSADEMSPATMGIPSWYSKYDRQLIFDKPFNLSTYGVRVRYYMSINQVDLAEGSTTRITRLLRSWRAVLIQGLLWKIHESNGDTQYAAAKKEFEELLPPLINKETPYGGEFEGFRTY